MPQASLAVSNGSVLTDNVVMSDGGAVYSLWSVGLLQVQGGSRLRSNRAGGYGGAIAVHSSVARLELRGASSLSRNNATLQDGGAVYIMLNATEVIIAEGSELSSNSANYWGGAIKVGHENNLGAIVRGAGYVGRVVVESGSQLRRNYARVHGGAMRFNGGVESILISGSYVEQNAAGNPASAEEANGGAFHIGAGLGELLLDLGASLSNNTASTWGGAVFATGNVGRMVLDRGSSISYNMVLQERSYGGAVASLYIDNSVTSSIELLRASRMVGNSAFSVGGAVVVAGSLGSLVVDAGSVLEANGACVGGTFHVVEGIQSMAFTNGSNVVANVASFRGPCRNARGGAVSSDGPVGSVVISGGSALARNSAMTSGGAIHCNSRLEEFLVTGGSALTRNTAGTSGGVLAVNGSISSFVISGGALVEGNDAKLDGGAFAIGMVGALSNTVGRMEVLGSVLRRNSASLGGAIHVLWRANEVVISDSEVSYNTASVTETSLSGFGGALYFGGRVRNLTVGNGTQIEHNSAVRSGGAFGFGGGLGTFTLAGNSSISHNRATGFTISNGGAVDVLGNLGRLEIVSGSTVGNNTASWLGGAFYVEGDFDNITAAVGTVLVDGSARVLSNIAGSGAC